MLGIYMCVYVGVKDGFCICYKLLIIKYKKY